MTDTKRRYRKAATDLLDAWDNLIPNVEAELSPHPQFAMFAASLNTLAELEGRRS